MLETGITKLFGIKYPIFGGAMNGLSRAELVAAQSNAGCLGIMVTAMYDTRDQVRQEIRKVKSLTDKPFAVNINLFPSARDIKTEDYIEVALEEGAPIIETSGRSPEPFMSLIRQGNVKFMHKCARLRDAVKVEQLGADAVSIVGFECGGHPGLDDVTSLVLAPMTADAVKIPVMAGGGFADGRGLMAALALGCDGVVIGTRFMATQECQLHPNVKEWMLKATESDTMIIQRSIRSNSRVARNEPAIQCVELENRGAPLEELLKVIGGEHGRELMYEGKMNAGTFPCGEVVGMIRDIPTVQELVERIVRQAEEVQAKLAK